MKITKYPYINSTENIQYIPTSENCKVYILLSRTSTRVSRLIGAVNKSEYTHASLAFDKNLKDMYSFGRRSLKFFLIAGFVSEDLKEGIFARNQNCNCILYELSVSSETYIKLRNIVADFNDNYSKYQYNILGLFAIQLGKDLPRKYKYCCSQFVAHALKESEACSIPKSIWLMCPDDFRNIKELKQVYVGELKNVLDFTNKKKKNLISSTKYFPKLIKE